ncbi:tetraacyldisaccharide-1-P synthase [Thiomonas sp. X19]|uniref:lipid-A-disaccharide synthase n=1 Tax=Thiomonas sp. X19 TaxID=1050370 RepID=UPI000B75DCA6|nr:lipid-A-disaccharide synthase [Thiomonas sp. X19]SCC95014.1 tetraacyldisaccharide-1-P synthase [Thiomonas sp. X19]
MSVGFVAMVAGEPSGDLLASHVLAALRQVWPDVACAGIGGERMREQGFTAWWSTERLAVNGYTQVLPRLPELLWMRRQLRLRLLRQPPAVFVAVDAPDFNLGLERRLREARIPTVHLVSPSIWAWRRERLLGITQAVDHMLCVFPFEPELYAQTRVRATYIGHPLAEVIPDQPDRHGARQLLGLAQDALVIGILPGSRLGEIQHIAPSFLGAARRLQQRHGARMVLPVAHPSLLPLLRRQLQAVPGLEVQFTHGKSHAVMAACDLALVASGTATLECALFKRPMVIGYRVPELSRRLMAGKGYQPWVGLPNILAREFLVPELLQDACTPDALAEAAERLLQDSVRRAQLQDRFAELHAQLRRPTASLAAQAILEAAKAG